ncbi:hypothetical protein AB4428_11205 [Vibrio lentus]
MGSKIKEKKPKIHKLLFANKIIKPLHKQIHKSGWQLAPNKTSDTAEEYIDAFLESARFLRRWLK